MLQERDKKVIWHPFTQGKSSLPPIPIKRAVGSYIYDENEKQYIDLVSSWWTNLHGHSHPEIAAAISKQANELAHIMFAECTHEPAVKLCELLKSVLPGSLSRFFFSDNGSTSVEVAVKIAYQFWSNQGQDKRLFLSFQGGYHGDTFGAMSVGFSSFHETFRPFFFNTLNIPFPETWIGDTMREEKEAKALAALKISLEVNGQNIAAFILEPLVQGASGMRMCSPEFVKKAIEMARSYNILIIYDEVMTGFGRTGSMFAMDQIGIFPDLVCLSKGLTGGCLPLALTVATEKIYEAFLSDDYKTAFLHGHTYYANPIACSASIASFDILMRPSTQDNIKRIQQIHERRLSEINLPKSRVCGTIAAFHLESASKYKAKFLEAGLLLRPLGDSLYILPPYSTAEIMDEVYDKLHDIIMSSPN